MIFPEMQLSLTSQRNEGQGRLFASSTARCLRLHEMAALEILVVTTRQSRRWIVPKGWPIKRLTPSKSAAREAFEEAGVRGKIGAKPIGNFRYKKAPVSPPRRRRLRGQGLPAAGQEAKRGLARIRTARGSVGRSGESDFAHPGTGAEVDRRKVCEARGGRSRQTHLPDPGPRRSPRYELAFASRRMTSE